MSVGPSERPTTPTTRSAAANSGQPILTGVRTSALRTGDLVLTNGMHVRLGERREYPGTRPEWPTVTAFAGTVENVDEVRAAGVVPESYLTRWEGQRIVARDSWTVQGNDLRTWSLLERGPRPTA